MSNVPKWLSNMTPLTLNMNPTQGKRVFKFGSTSSLKLIWLGIGSGVEDGLLREHALEHGFNRLPVR